MKKPRKSKPVGVLTKTFHIIETLRSSASPLTLKDISELTGINKSTALRFLTHLENERYVTRDSRAGYSVGARLLQLGVRSTFHVNLLEAARLPLRELWRVTQETVNLGVLDTIEVVYLDCIESPQSFRLVANPGTRAVVYRTALGKAILAYLPQEQVAPMIASLTFQAFTPKTITSATMLRKELERAAQQGYAIDDEESVLGVRCFAAGYLQPAEGTSGRRQRFRSDGPHDRRKHPADRDRHPRGRAGSNRPPAIRGAFLPDFRFVLKREVHHGVAFCR